jgi:transposase
MGSNPSTITGAQLMDYPPAVIEKAHRLESLLQRVTAGEPFESVRAELGLTVSATELPKLQARYEAGGCRWEALLDGRFGHSQTVNSAMREWLYARKRQDPTLRAPALAAALEQEFGVSVAAGHINYLLRKVGLTSPPGRPFRRPPPPAAVVPPLAPDPPVANAGLFFPRGCAAGHRGWCDGGHNRGNGR